MENEFRKLNFRKSNLNSGNLYSGARLNSKVFVVKLFYGTANRNGDYDMSDIDLSE